MKKLLLFSLFALLASAMSWATTETWVKVTSTPDSWDGDYLIVYEAENVAFDGSRTTLDAANNTKPVTISDGTITTTDCNFYFTIASNGSNYTIQSESGYYIGRTTTGNGFDSSKTEKYTNTITFSGSNVSIASSGGPKLQFYTTKSDKRFRYYRSTQKPIALYKKSEAPATKVAPLEISPAIGDLPKGTEVTISCATEGAVLNGTVGETTLTGQALPYTFTASVLGDLKVEVKASKEGLEDSEPLTGTYNVYQPKVEALKITPGFGTIEVGTVVTISCATERAVLNGTVGETTLAGQALPYTFTASEVGTINVKVSATKEEYDESDLLDGEFTVKAAVPVAYRDLITKDDEEFEYTTSYKEFDLIRGGAAYQVKAVTAQNTSSTSKTVQFIQLNNNKSNAGIVMNVSNAAASKIIIKWNESHSNTLNIYGKNIPYTATSELYGSDKGDLIGTATYDAESTVVELDGTYTYIGLVSAKGAMKINSIEFIWNEGAAGGADVTYTKASEVKAGNFAVLATADGKAVGRNADLNPVAVTVSGDAIGLNKSQPDVDEFEIVEKDAVNKKFQLCGGLSSDGSRRFLTYDAAGGVTTTAATVTKVDGKDVVSTTDANADVTFESTAAGLLVKFNDGEYLMFNGTNFVKGECTEVATQAEGETLTPVIVFLSSSNVSTGVEIVEIDENAAVQYFNLNGVQVKAENLTPGLYIVRQGNKVSKQVIR